MLSRPEVRFGPFADVFRTPDTPYGDLNAPAPDDELLSNVVYGVIKRHSYFAVH